MSANISIAEEFPRRKNAQKAAIYAVFASSKIELEAKDQAAAKADELGGGDRNIATGTDRSAADRTE